MTIAAEKIVLEKPPFIVFRKHETPSVIGRCLTLSTIVMPDFSKNRLIGGQPCVKRTFAIRPGEKVAKLVKRMHYISFVGMLRSDLFEEKLAKDKMLRTVSNVTYVKDDYAEEMGQATLKKSKKEKCNMMR